MTLWLPFKTFGVASEAEGRASNQSPGLQIQHSVLTFAKELKTLRVLFSDPPVPYHSVRATRLSLRARAAVTPSYLPTVISRLVLLI